MLGRWSKKIRRGMRMNKQLIFFAAQPERSLKLVWLPDDNERAGQESWSFSLFFLFLSSDLTEAKARCGLRGDTSRYDPKHTSFPLSLSLSTISPPTSSQESNGSDDGTERVCAAGKVFSLALSLSRPPSQRSLFPQRGRSYFPPYLCAS